jgi:hypothetical protein
MDPSTPVADAGRCVRVVFVGRNGRPVCSRGVVVVAVERYERAVWGRLWLLLLLWNGRATTAAVVAAVVVAVPVDVLLLHVVRLHGLGDCASIAAAVADNGRGIADGGTMVVDGVTPRAAI